MNSQLRPAAVSRGGRRGDTSFLHVRRRGENSLDDLVHLEQSFLTRRGRVHVTAVVHWRASFTGEG